MKKRIISLVRLLTLSSLFGSHRFDSFRTFLHTKIATLKKPYFLSDNDQEDWIVRDDLDTYGNSARVIWIGHSTFLIQIAGINILTDPVFFDISFFYRRAVKPGLRIDELPEKIHFIILSHDHIDHMCAKSLLKLRDRTSIVLVPNGLKKWFRRRGFNNVGEMGWGESVSFHISGNNIIFTFLPANHWSGRGILDAYENVLYGSWLLSTDDLKIYFAGDSIKGEHFREIGETYSPDVALLPIAPNEPNYLMRRTHLSTEEACEMFLALKAKILIPMHWGTFRFGTEHFDEPVKRIVIWWDRNKSKLENKILKIAKFGEPVELK
ncbi:MBL fold metallo-hydrolase [Candidatus Babeliales bacterium]|nr:MBL fold metallo-hydrolase [Candidatus Babeliales bacterium]